MVAVLAEFAQFDKEEGRKPYLSLDYITHYTLGHIKPVPPLRHSNATKALPYFLPSAHNYVKLNGAVSLMHVYSLCPSLKYTLLQTLTNFYKT
jgi:hypothetical protein